MDYIFTWFYEGMFGNTTIDKVFKLMNPGVVEFLTYVGYLSVLSVFVFLIYLVVYFSIEIVKRGLEYAFKLGIIMLIVGIVSLAGSLYMQNHRLDDFAASMHSVYNKA